MLALLFTLFTCGWVAPQNTPALSKEYLQGIWAEDLTESNALFTVQGDSIYYTEDPLKAYRYTVLSDSQLKIAFDGFDETLRIDVINDSTMAFLDEKGQPELLLHKR